MWTYLVQNSSCATSVCSILHQKGSLSGLWCTLSGGGAGAESTDPRSENYLGPTDQTRPLVRRHTPSPIYFVRTTTPAAPDRRQWAKSEEPALGIWAGWFAFEKLGLIRSEKLCLCQDQLSWSCWCCNPSPWWWSSSSCCDVNMVDAAAWRGGWYRGECLNIFVIFAAKKTVVDL